LLARKEKANEQQPRHFEGRHERSPRRPWRCHFQDLITRYAWGEIWTRPGLDRKTRSCMVLTAMMALGHWEEFRMHVRAGFTNGLSEDDLKEVILQAAIYCGVPVANHAFKEAAEVIDGLGKTGAA
jgi:alkylhydroperoxidase/carboxymuconolactone decarboxylase family protein YurZ